MSEEKIYYRTVRDLGGIFAAAFGFIRQNFKMFFGSILLYAGPFLLIGTIVSSYMLHSAINFAAIGNFAYNYQEILSAYAIVITIMFIGVSVYNVILNKNIIENEKLTEHEPLTIRQVSHNFFDDYWRVLGNMFLLGITIAAVFGILFMVFFALFTIGGGTSGLGILMVFIFIAFAFIFLPVLIYIPLAAMFVCQRDKVNIFEALGKVMRYLSGNFWNTWVVSFIALLCYSVMAMFAQLPVYIITFITAFTRAKSTIGYGAAESSTPMLLVVITSVCTLISYMVMSVYYLMNIFQYTSLEEKKEGSSILEKINQIQ